MQRTKTPSIFHGPVNICGIGRKLADWQREKKGVESSFFVFKDTTGFQNSHLNLHLEDKNFFQSWRARLKLFFMAIKKYDVFHFYFAKSFFPLNLDLPLLKLFNKKIIMQYVGSDIRLYKVHTEISPFYHLRRQKSRIDHFDLIKKIRMRWQSLWFDHCVIGPSLMIYAKKAIPRHKIHTINLSKAISVSKNPDFTPKKIPVIMHAPTDVFTKGTEYVRHAIKELKDKGYQFDFHLFQNEPHEKLMHFLENEADIVVDQFFSGGFGVFAVEAMSFGKPVCSFIRDDIHALFPDLPIIQCDIHNLAQVLEELINHPKKISDAGQKSWEFTKEHFDRDRTYEKLWQLYIK